MPLGGPALTLGKAAARGVGKAAKTIGKAAVAPIVNRKKDKEEPQDPNAPLEGDMDLSGDMQQDMPMDPQAMQALQGAGVPM